MTNIPELIQPLLPLYFFPGGHSRSAQPDGVKALLNGVGALPSSYSDMNQPDESGAARPAAETPPLHLHPSQLGEERPRRPGSSTGCGRPEYGWTIAAPYSPRPPDTPPRPDGGAPFSLLRASWPALPVHCLGTPAAGRLAQHVLQDYGPEIAGVRKIGLHPSVANRKTIVSRRTVRLAIALNTPLLAASDFAANVDRTTERIRDQIQLPHWRRNDRPSGLLRCLVKVVAPFVNVSRTTGFKSIVRTRTAN